MSNFSATLVFAKSFSIEDGFNYPHVIKTDEYLNPQKLPRKIKADGRASKYSIKAAQQLKTSSFAEVYEPKELLKMKLFLVSSKGTVMEILNFGFEEEAKVEPVVLLKVGDVVIVKATLKELSGFSTNSEIKSGEAYRIEALSLNHPRSYKLETVSGTTIQRSHVKVEWATKFEL